MFSQVFVCPYGYLHDVTWCLDTWSHVPSGKSLSLVSCSFPRYLFLVPYSFLRGSLSRGLCPMRSLGRGVSVQGGLFPMWSLFKGALWRGSLSRGSLSGGVSVQEVSVRRPPGIRKLGDMHPTGMLSCLKNVFILFIYDIDPGHIENGS